MAERRAAVTGLKLRRDALQPAWGQGGEDYIRLHVAVFGNSLNWCTRLQYNFCVVLAVI